MDLDDLTGKHQYSKSLTFWFSTINSEQFTTFYRSHRRRSLCSDQFKIQKIFFTQKCFGLFSFVSLIQLQLETQILL